MKNDKFLKVLNKTENTVDLLFYGDIVSSACEFYPDDKCPKDVADFLKDANGRDLNVYINSGGGNVFAGYAIYNQLKRYSGKVNVYVDGLAGSIASVIAFAGDTLTMPKNTFLMIHKPYCGIIGNSDELRKVADNLDRLETSLLGIYEEHLNDNVDIETIKQMVSAETWLSAEDAQKYFKISVTEENKAVAYCNVSDFANVPQKIKETINKTATNPKNELLQAKLNLIRIKRKDF